ncbi:MAG TPA: hypothetical protein VFB58_13955 [Chloroflexota bacterium]|nr:hypothetical protein [Chloroflexota bacterium]
MKLRLSLATVVVAGGLVWVGYGTPAHAAGLPQFQTALQSVQSLIPATGAPDYLILAESEHCDDGTTSCFSTGLGYNLSYIVAVQFSTAVAGKPDEVVALCEHESTAGVSQEAVGFGVDANYPGPSSYIVGSSTSGIGIAPGTPTSTSAFGLLAASGVPGPVLQAEGYGSVHVTGADTANNVTETMLSGSLKATITGPIYGSGGTTYGTMSCSAQPGGPLNVGVNERGVFGIG